ncbi:MFS transporter [Actinacidiphila yeochonensis]|uniref:MFS transporter n=1 Tax=Actinacidiphila yeochonensis TaxID=89050 RepID=UPI001E5CA7F4|nr:MFS transporter [Actinacidiphila yeochonensis]
MNKIGTTLSRSRPAGTDPVLYRVRIAVSAFFALDGFVFAGWVVRIPAIKAQVGASAGQLGLALLGVSAGAVAVMMLTGRMCRAFGNERMTVVTGTVLSLSIALPPRTHTALSLGLVLVLFGICYGSLNVAMNSAAVDVVAALDRPVMSSFHGAYSLGALLGAGVGGLLAPHLSPSAHLLLLTPVGLLTVFLAGRVLLAHPLSHPGRRVLRSSGEGTEGSNATAPSGERADGAERRVHAAPRTGTEAEAGARRGPGTDAATAPPAGDGLLVREGTRPARDRLPRATERGQAAGHPEDRGERRRTAFYVVVIGLIAACSAYGEGAIAEWGALHLQQDLHTGPALAAAGYGAVTLTMTVGRLSGTALITRIGHTRALVLGGLAASAGMLLGALAPFTALVVLGFAVTGLGLANLFPTAIARAGALTGPSGVAVASTLGYGGMLIGPPSIGFITEGVGLPVALTTVSVLAAVAAGIAWLVRGGSTPGVTVESRSE